MTIDTVSETWRKGLALRHKRASFLDTVLTIPNEAKWMTSMVSIPETSLIAISCGSKTNNLFLVENTAKPRSDEISSDALSLRSSMSMPTSVFDMSAHKGHLAAAGNNGLVHLYRLDIAESGYKKGFTFLQSLTLGSTNKAEPAAPGEMMRSQRINGIDLKSCTIAATQEKSLLVYDIVSNQTLFSKNISNSHLFPTQFSPHSSLLSVGGYDSVVRLYDTRTNENVWKMESKDGYITDIKFNPFIPYWLASSTGNGAIHVWDLRFLQGPSARIDGHFGPVQSIAWSNTHVDVITSVASEWKAWCLSSDIITAKKPQTDYFIGCPGSEFQTTQEATNPKNLVVGGHSIGRHTHPSPLIKVLASPLHPDAYYCLSAVGKLSCHVLEKSMFEKMAEHQYSEPTPKMIESAIHARDLDSAYEGMIQWSRKGKSAGYLKAKHEDSLLELCSFRPSVSTWNVGTSLTTSEEQVMAAFLKDLNLYKNGLPPGFHKTMFVEVDPKLQLQFDLVVQRAHILSEIEEGNHDILIQQKESIYAGMEQDPEFLDADTLYLISETLLTHKYSFSMEMCLKFAEIYADYGNAKFSQLTDFIGLVMFPTVFDAQEYIPDREVTISKLSSTFLCNKVSEYIQHYKKTPPTDNKPEASGRFARKNSFFNSQQPHRRPSNQKPIQVREDVDMMRKKEALKPLMNDPKSIIPMLYMENRARKLLDSDVKPSEVLKIMTNVMTDVNTRKYEKTISAYLNLLHLETLLSEKEFIDYFNLAIDLVVTYRLFYFGRHVLKIMEKDGILKFKSTIEQMYQSANAGLQTTIIPSNSGPPQGSQYLIQASKILRDAIVLLVKVSANFISCQESLKNDKDMLDIIQKVLTAFTQFMSQLVSSLLKSFDALDKVLGQREWAQTVHDSLRDAARVLPLSNKTRPTQASEKAATGYTIHEETFSALDRIYKSYIKVE